MRTVLVTSSRNVESRSSRLADIAGKWLVEKGAEISRIHVQRDQLPGLNHDNLYETPIYREYSQLLLQADSIILATPVYNWSFCADMKHFIEVVGSTDVKRPAPFFDKLVSFIFAAGLPHSYMVMSSLAAPLMMDFRCIINPHHAYVHNRHWDAAETLTADGQGQLERMLNAHVDLTKRLKGYSQTTCWQT